MSTPGKSRTSALTVERVSVKEEISGHTSAFTRRRSYITAVSVGGVSHTRAHSNSTNASTPERNRITAPSVEKVLPSKATSRNTSAFTRGKNHTTALSVEGASSRRATSSSTSAFTRVYRRPPRGRRPWETSCLAPLCSSGLSKIIRLYAKAEQLCVGLISTFIHIHARFSD